MLLWNLFLRNNEAIMCDSVQVVTFSFCMLLHVAFHCSVCVCLITSDKWKEKKLHSWPLQWGKHGSGTVWSSSAGFGSTQCSQWFSNCGWPWEEKNWNYAKSVIFTENKQTKKSPRLFCFVTVALCCIQLKFQFISPSHPIPGLLHYSHESSLRSFSFPPTSQHHLHHPLSNRSAIVPPERVQTISASALNLLSLSCPSVALFSIVVPPGCSQRWQTVRWALFCFSTL